MKFRNYYLQNFIGRIKVVSGKANKINLLILLMGLLLTACVKEENSVNNNQNENNKNPLDNGTSQRNMVVVISDVHLGTDLSYSEIKNNLKPLEKFLNNIKSSPNVKELVIAGDLIDEWFVPADVDAYEGKDQSDFIKRIAATNKNVVDVFNSIIKEGKIKVVYVPGNHDLTITAQSVEELFPGISQARDKELGLGTYTPADLPWLAIEHSHRYNFFCAPDMISNQDIAPGTILPPGYFFTRIAAQHFKQKCTANKDVIPTLTLSASADESQKLLYLYSKVWNWALGVLPINNYFNEKIIITSHNGFKGNYSVNDLFPYQSQKEGAISVKLFNGIQDSWEARQAKNLVAVKVPTEQAIVRASSADETDLMAQTQYFLNPKSPKRIVVFGHNHRATIIPFYNYKGLKSIYANSGTWIDHNSLGATATFVIITPQSENPSSLTKVATYNFENEVYTEMAMNTVRL